MPNVFLSGGSLNADPEKSLGGSPSSTPVQFGSASSNLFGGVSVAERLAGKMEHRLVYVFATAPMTDIRAYVKTETPLEETTVGLAWGGPINSIAGQIPNETTPPPNITFVETTNPDLAPSGGNLSVGQWLPLWIRLRVAPGTPNVTERFGISFRSTNAVPSIIFAPVLEGSASEGQTVRMTPGVWSPTPTSYSYQWQASADGLAGWVAFGSLVSVPIGSGQVGKYVRGRVIGINSEGPSDPAYTAIAGPVGSTVPINTSAPVLSGSAQEGGVLTVSTGAWTNAPTGYNYAWRMSTDGSNWTSAGLSGASLAMSGVHVGKQIQASVAGVNGAGPGAAVNSNIIGPVVTGRPVNEALPVISGLLEVNQVLTTSNGSWSRSPTSYQYQWQQATTSGGTYTDISGATSQSFTLTATQASKFIKAKVWGVNAGGPSTTPATSAATGVIAAAPSTPGGTGAGANEATVMMSTARLLSKTFFGVSTRLYPWYGLAGAPVDNTYGVNRYYSDEPGSGRSTELTYLANGLGSFDDMKGWAALHAQRGADVMFQIYLNGGWGSATSLSQSQWTYIKQQIELFLQQANGAVKYLAVADEPQFTSSPGFINLPSPFFPSRSATLYAQYCRVVKQLVNASPWANVIKVIGPEVVDATSNRRLDVAHVLEADAGGPDVGYGNGSGTKMKDWIDIISFHGFHNEADGGYASINALKTVLSSAGVSSKPLWQTNHILSYATYNNTPIATIVEIMARHHAAEVATGVATSIFSEWGQNIGAANTRWEAQTSQGAALRAWWTQYSNWWRGAFIGRIALLNDGKIRVTRSDGDVLLIPDDLSTKFGPLP